MASIVIVRVGVDQHTALLDLVAIINSAAKFARPVNDGLVPRRRLLLDALAIPEPSNVCPVCRNRIEVQFPGTRHPEAILEHERDSVIAQQIRQFSVEPSSISNLNCKLVGLWEFSEERNQPVQKFMPVSKGVS